MPNCVREHPSHATHPHTLDATPLSRHATLPQVPRYGVQERSEHGGLERVQRTFRTGRVRCSCKLRSRRPAVSLRVCVCLTFGRLSAPFKRASTRHHSGLIISHTDHLTMPYRRLFTMLSHSCAHLHPCRCGRRPTLWQCRSFETG